MAFCDWLLSQHMVSRFAHIVACASAPVLFMADVPLCGKLTVSMHQSRGVQAAVKGAAVNIHVQILFSIIWVSPFVGS